MGQPWNPVLIVSFDLITRLFTNSERIATKHACLQPASLSKLIRQTPNRMGCKVVIVLLEPEGWNLLQWILANSFFQIRRFSPFQGQWNLLQLVQLWDFKRGLNLEGLLFFMAKSTPLHRKFMNAMFVLCSVHLTCSTHVLSEKNIPAT